MAQTVKHLLQCGRPRFNHWVRKISWRRKWQPSPVFLPGKSHGWGNLVGYSPWGRKESDMTEQLHLMKVKGRSQKASLNLDLQKTNIMASSPITSWQIDGETMETVMGFIFLGSKITVDGGCSHKIKRHLLLERKAMTQLDSVFLKVLQLSCSHEET